jgi:uncharacterized protein (TIGR03437 family)
VIKLTAMRPAHLVFPFAVYAATASGQAPKRLARVDAIESHIVSATGPASLGIMTINLPANSLAWDPNSAKIYLSLPSAAGPNGNAIQVLDPVTGQLGANVFAGSEPDELAVSSTGMYLYVGLNGASTLQRMTLPDLGLDIKIALGSNSFDGPLFASDVEASPVADGTVAVVRSAADVSPSEEGGVVIYDNGVARPGVLCGFIQSGCTGSGGELFDSIQWNADGTVMFAANNEDTGFDFYSVPVTATGFGKVTDYPGLVGGFGSRIHFDSVTGYVYDDDGSIIDPVAGAQVGKFDQSGLVVPDGSLGMAFVLSSSFGGSTVTLTAFDIHRFTPIATATISNVVGTPQNLIRWGSSGLAFTTQSSVSGNGSAVYVLSGSFVGPSAAPLIDAGGVAPVGSSANVVQPGEWVSIYGGNLANGTATWNGDFPTWLGGTSVLVDGKPAYLSYVSPWQVNLQVPDDTAIGPVSVVLTNGAGTVTSSVTLAPFAPSFPLLDTEHVAAIIPRSDHSGAYDGGAYDILGPTGNSLGYATVAAKAGDTVWLYAFGLGPTDPVVPSGQAFSGAAPTTNTVTLSINNVSIPLLFSGLSRAGLYQLNFTVPAGLGSGDLPIAVSVGGSQSPSSDVISLQ